MSEKRHLEIMAEYNQLMNQRMINAVDSLSKAELLADKGAFFGSILGTLNHILVGDMIWLKRIQKSPSASKVLSFLDQMEKPQQLNSLLFDELKTFIDQRKLVDAAIISLCQHLTSQDLEEELDYSNMKGEQFSKRLGDLMLHLFLHQIHHRGQITTLLSQADIDFGETDLVEII